MNEIEPYKISSINFDNIVYKKTKMINKTKIIFLKYKENKLNNFVIQLSNLYNNKVLKSNEIEYNIKNDKLIDFFNNLDDYIIEESKKHIEWFNHLDDISSINYQRILHTDEDNNNYLKLKLFNSDELTTKLIINDEIQKNFDNLQDIDSTSKIILEFFGIWIKSNTFGLFLRPIIILINYNETFHYNYKFVENSDESDDKDNDEYYSDSNSCDESNNVFINDDNSSSSDIENDLSKLILGLK